MDPPPHRLAGYLFTPNRVIRVLHVYGDARRGPFATIRASAPLAPAVFRHLVLRIATPQFFARHVYDDRSLDQSSAQSVLAVRQGRTQRVFRPGEPAGNDDRQFSYTAEIVVGNALHDIPDGAWQPVSDGEDPFTLCSLPHSAFGRFVRT